MRTSAEYRKTAWEALKGRWTVAVIAGLVAGFLGAGGFVLPNFRFSFGSRSSSADLNSPVIKSMLLELKDSRLLGIIIGVFVVVFAFCLLVGIAWYLVGSIVRVGYAQFNLNLLDREKEPAANILFDYFKYFKPIALTSLLMWLHIFVGTLLLIIPGIMASYSYAAVPFLLAAQPELSPREALDKSRDLMHGHRWRLFCLQWSFFGWILLCVLTLGIGFLWLGPYTWAADAEFIRERVEAGPDSL